MANIKTKDVIKGSVKSLDRAATATERMKQTYVSTKEKATQIMHSDESSGEEYATNQSMSGIDMGTRVVVQKLNEVGYEHTKITYQNMKKLSSHEKGNVTQQGMRRFKVGRNQTIRTTRGTEKEAKQSLASAGNKNIKKGRKVTKKTSSRYLKTAEKTSKTAIKTAEHTAKVTKNTVKVSGETVKRTAHATKAAMKASIRSVALAIKGTILAMKAMIASVKALISALGAGGWIAVVIILICVILGAAISIVGNEEGSGYLPVSQEVEAYTPLITEYAKQYDVPEYVELIKAVMMQESGGRGRDPMQASESGFNTKYPREPNGITDTTYSIQCGIQQLKASLISAEVENPIDMERIKLALQGYNFGNGYITWAKDTYGGYTYANAVEFSEIQAEKLGWDSYGDTMYVSHVLRYYPYGRAFTEGGNQAIVEVALSQLGNKGGEPYWSWYGFDSRVEWCATFVSWCADQSGYIESGVIPKYALCRDGARWFQERNQWADRNAEPSAGTIIFFDWNGDGNTEHTGIVEKCENGIVYTIEGNSGNECRQRTYSVGETVIYGYGIPAY